MKNFKNINKKIDTSRQTMSYWQSLLEWLKLLVISITRERMRLTGSSRGSPQEPFQEKIFFKTIPIVNGTKHRTNHLQKIKIMKPIMRLIQLSLVLLLVGFAAKVKAQGPYPKTGNDTVCVNSIHPYGVANTAGSTYQWIITPVTGGNGTFVTAQGLDTIQVHWTTAGVARLQVVETNAQGCAGDTVSIDVLINALPLVTITGPTPICAHDTGTYVTQGGMTNYQWSQIGGVVVGGGTSTDSTITIVWNTSGSVSVNYANPNGCYADSAFTLPVTVNAQPVITITGPTPICAHDTGTYVTQGGMTNYQWSQTGGVVVGGGTSTDSTITIVWNTSGFVSVNYNNATSCHADSAFVYPVTVNAQPVITITGPTPICAHDTGTYVTQGGMTNYQWSQTGGVVVGGGTSTDSTITIVWNTSGSVSVNYSNANGCHADTATVYNVTVNAQPVITISGPTTRCQNDTATYTTQGGMTNYQWGQTGGTTIGGGTSADSSITIIWNGTAPFTVSVNYSNGTGCHADTATVLNITVNPIPTPAITGLDTVCQSVNNATVQYCTTNVPGNTYNWTVTGGTIVSGQGTSCINVQWTTPGTGTVSVTETVGTSGCSAVANKTVLVNPKPNTTPITHN